MATDPITFLFVFYLVCFGALKRGKGFMPALYIQVYNAVVAPHRDFAVQLRTFLVVGIKEKITFPIEVPLNDRS